MKKLYLLIFFLIFHFFSHAQQFNVVNDFGVDCILHKVDAKESFYKIAKKYYVRPSTLAICNNIEEDVSVLDKKVLYIPLTETNYYKIRQTDNSNTVFRELTHIVKKDETLKQIETEYFVSQKQLLDWNKQKDIKSLSAGDKLVIGFIKYDLNIEREAPSYIKEEKFTFGNEREKAEVEVDSKMTKSKKKRAKKYEQQLAVEKELKLKKNETITVENQISDKEKEFLKKKVKKKKRKKKKLFASSYAKQKAEREAAIQARIEARRKVLKKEERKRLAFAQKNAGADAKSQLRNKKLLAKNSKQTSKNITDGTGDITAPDVKKKEPIVEENPFIKTKLQRLTLLKNTSGKAAFFYSGTAGAKFYVFTNLAKKGGIIKIKNTKSGKFILAEVIDALPNADRNRGVKVKISDNAKMPLGTKSKYFTAKVYY